MAPTVSSNLARPPIVITGGHRSGTTLVARLLDRLGVWLGELRDENFESIFFLRRNEWILRRAGGAWDYPLPVERFLREPCFLDPVVERLRGDLDSRRFSEFTGRSGWMRRARGSVLEGPWGWKDPRNVFTMPAWRPIFPEASLIVVQRHGVDAAASMSRRESQRWRNGAEPGFFGIPPASPSLLDPAALRAPLEPYVVSTRCLELGSSFELWEEYAERGRALYEDHAGAKLLVRFESLCAEPRAELARLARFVGLEPEAEVLGEIASTVRADRALAFERDPDLLAFHEGVRSSPALEALGYGAGGGSER